MTQRHEVSKMPLEEWHLQTGLTQGCHKPSICEKARSVKHCKAKHSKMRYLLERHDVTWEKLRCRSRSGAQIGKDERVKGRNGITARATIRASGVRKVVWP